MKNKQIKETIVDCIASDIGDFGIEKFELALRTTVKLDEEQFNPNEDEGVWLQKRGKTAKVCEVYFDNVWCCDVKSTDIKTSIRIKYFRGFLKGYESGKIRLNRFLATIEAEKEEAAFKQIKIDRDNIIENLPTATPEEKMSKSIIREIALEND